MDKNNWFDVSLRKFSEISILNILEKLDYKSHKLLYRFNDASWDFKFELSTILKSAGT